VATRAGHDNKKKEGAAVSGEGEGGVHSKAREGKGRAIVMAAAAGTSATVVGKTTLNSFPAK